MQDNPYQPPQYSQVPPKTAAEQLKLPAIFLLVCEIPWAAYLLLGSLIQIPQVVAAFQNDAAVGVGRCVGIFLMNVVSIGVIWGAIDMLRMNSLRSARAGAILALVPICGPCVFFGIPLGIWTLIVLARPEVKAGFAKP